MTCIVALKKDGVIYMGADSAGVAGYKRANRADPKIYRVGEMLIGFTSSFRMGQLLGHALTLPKHYAEEPLEKYMATSFIDAVRNCLKTGGFAEKDKDAEVGGFFLVGYKKRIFQIESDYQVGEVSEDFDAVGCGSELALGSLATSAYMHTATPQWRLEEALRVAAYYSSGVYAPFRIEQLPA